MPAPLINPLLTQQGQSWFSNWMPSFTWGGGADAPSPNAASNPTGPNHSMGPPPPAPLPPPEFGGDYARRSPEGGPTAGFVGDTPEAASNALTSVDPLSSSTEKKKYSFLDNPGASDALVAFGAAMLKAPDFNSGLGDAALAVNKVARENRPISENEYARARELARVKAIASGKGIAPGGVQVNRDILYRGADGHTYFDAVGPNGEAGLLDQNTGKFTTDPVPGLTRDVYDYNSNRDRRLSGKDADFEMEIGQKVPSMMNNAANFQRLYELSSDDSTGIDTNYVTRVSRQLETILPNSGFTNLDPNNITEFNNLVQNAALEYARTSFQGQGQVTENERLMIKEAVGQPGTLTKQSAKMLFKVMHDAELRKVQAYKEWKSSADLRDSYGNSFSAYWTDVMIEAGLHQMEQRSGGSSATANSGGRRPLGEILGP